MALVFIGHYAWRSHELYGSLLAQARPAYLLAALFCWTSLHLSVSPACTSRLLESCGATVPFWPALRIHTRNLPGRYVPGGIWHTIGRLSDLHLRGVNPAQIASFVFLESTMAAGVALAIGGISVYHFRGFNGWGVAGACGALGGPILLVVAPLFVNLKIMSKFKSVDVRNYAIAVGWTILFWLIAGTSFVGYLFAFPFASDDFSFVEAGGGYLFSWGVGFISIFSPQGIGVSEAVMASVLPSHLPFASIMTLAAGFRIVVFGADALAWVLSLLPRMRQNRE